MAAELETFSDHRFIEMRVAVTPQQVLATEGTPGRGDGHSASWTRTS